MTCDELAAQLTTFLEGGLPADVEAEALDHLATCTACELVLAGTRDAIDAAGRYGQVRLEPDARAALLDRIAVETADDAGT
ncbi:MAG: hypothetical protein R2695_09325 [Acidimicrobiales bacterium]